MKKTIVIIILNLLFFSCFGQDSVTKIYHRFGAGVCTQFSVQSMFSKTPYVSYALPNHKFALGVIISKRPVNQITNIWHEYYNSSMTTEDKNRVIGASASYRFFPNPAGKVFDLYFEYKLNWVMMRSIIDYHIAEAYFHSFENLISYGMVIKLPRYVSFFVGQGVGIIFNAGRYSHYDRISLYDKNKFSVGMYGGLDFHL